MVEEEVCRTLMEPFIFFKSTYLWAMVPPATVAPSFLTKNTEPLQVYTHLLMHMRPFPAVFPPSSHIPTSSNTFIATPLLSTRSRYSLSPLPVHLTVASKYTTLLTSLINVADTWPTPPALTPVCTLPHESCRNVYSPFPLRLCQFIYFFCHLQCLGFC